MRFKKMIAAGICFLLPVCMLSGCGKEEIQTISAEIGTIEQTVEDTGIVVFDNSYSVTTGVNAKIISSHFEEGDTVEKGQLLYTLDNREISNQIAQANINLEKANETYRQSAAAVSDLTVKSFTNGLVTEIYCNVGDVVSVGTKIADIVDSETLTLEVPFSVTDQNIYKGQAVQVVMSADGSIINGMVTKVYGASQVFDGRQYGVNVEISITNPGALKQGDLAFAKIGDMSSVTEGSLKNKTEQSITAAQAGQVQSLNIVKGDKVYSGSVIMTIKNDSLQNAVNTASLSIKDIKNNISQLNSKLSDYQIMAPVSGVVVSKTAREPDFAATSTPLAVIGNNERLFINMDIDEMYINDIQVGQKAEAYIQGDENTVYTGSVDKISDSGTEKNGVTYYTVRIYLDNQENLMEAMNMDVKIIIQSKDNVMKIPVSAIQGNKVKISDGKKEVEKEVEIGIKNKKYVEIVSGLSKDDQIITGGK